MAKVTRPLQFLILKLTATILLVVFPPLYLALSTIVEMAVVEGYIDDVRSSLHLRAADFQPPREPEAQAYTVAFLDEYMLNPKVVYAEVVIDNRQYLSSYILPADALAYREDHEIQDHGDNVYYMSAPLFIHTLSEGEEYAYIRAGFDETQVIETYRLAKIWITVALLVAAAMILAVILTFSYHLTAPLVALANASKVISGGTSDKSMEVETSIRELGSLSCHLEEMRKELLFRNQQLRRQASIDVLTGIPNRLVFSARLHEAIEINSTQGVDHALVVVDVDRFKEINDNHGHLMGDKVVAIVAKRLKHMCRTGDLVARIGGDEFGIILRDIDIEGLHRFCQKVQSAIAKPIVLGELVLNSSASVGATLFQRGVYTAENYIRQADMAMYNCKKKDKRHVVFEKSDFAESIRDGILKRDLKTLTAAENAIGLCVRYHPMFSLATGEIVGVEALARWQHSTFGWIAPDVFIAIAEEEQVIQHITDFMLNTAVAQAKVWRDMGFALPVSINMSPHDLQDPSVTRRILSVLRRHGLPPHLIELEVTENVAIRDTGAIQKVLASIQAMGISIAIDDFGTGYAGFQNLRALHVDTLKIDKCFIQEMLTNHEDEIIVNGAIEIAHKLGIKVVAEGVESEKIAAALARHKCDIVQGFYYCQPMEAEEITRRYLLQIAGCF